MRISEIDGQGMRQPHRTGVRSSLLISKYGFTDVLADGNIVLDPSRVAAQIVTGIGFIGAGLIFVRGDYGCDEGAKQQRAEQWAGPCGDDGAVRDSYSDGWNGIRRDARKGGRVWAAQEVRVEQTPLMP